MLEAKGESVSEYMNILETYLPKMASKDEIREWIQSNIDVSGFKSPNQAMGPIMKHFGKRADGSVVKEILQEMSDDSDK